MIPCRVLVFTLQLILPFREPHKPLIRISVCVRALQTTRHRHIVTQGWTRIAKAVNADTTTSNRILYDVLNEPDAFGVKFEQQGNVPGMRDLYFKAFDAIYNVNPSAHCHTLHRPLLLETRRGPHTGAVCGDHRSCDHLTG